MRDVREKLLANQFQTLQPGYIEKDPYRAGRITSLVRTHGHYPEIEDSFCCAVRFYLYASPFGSAHCIKKCVIDRWVPRQLSERTQINFVIHQGKQTARGPVRSYYTHVGIDYQ